MSIQMILASFFIHNTVFATSIVQENRAGQKTLDTSMRLTTPFLFHGQLVLGWATNGELHTPDALRGWQNLFLVLPSRTVVIGELRELQGHVTIQSPRDALDYVRLRTSPATFHAFRGAPILRRGRIAEVFPKERLHELAFFGCENVYSELRGYSGEGYLGIVSQSSFDSLDLMQPQVRTMEGGFEVERWIVYLESSERSSAKVVRVKEFVAADGGYEIAEESILDSVLANKIIWSLRVH